MKQGVKRVLFYRCSHSGSQMAVVTFAASWKPLSFEFVLDNGEWRNMREMSETWFDLALASIHAKWDLELAKLVVS